MKRELVAAKTAVSDKSFRFCSAVDITKHIGQFSPEHSWFLSRAMFITEKIENTRSKTARAIRTLFNFLFCISCKFH